MSTIPREPAILLQGLTWRNYVDLRDAPENDHVRMTFDRGSRELMSPIGLRRRVRILIG